MAECRTQSSRARQKEQPAAVRIGLRKAFRHNPLPPARRPRLAGGDRRDQQKRNSHGAHKPPAAR